MPPEKIENILVLGSGNFGTCLAQHLARKGHDVTIWSRDVEVVMSINVSHRNPKYLSQILLSENLKATNEVSSNFLNQFSVIVLAIPTQYLRETLKKFDTKLKSEILVVSAIKGIETKSGNLPNQIVEQVLGKEVGYNMVALSGPSFAIEVAEELPTAVTMASHVMSRANWGQEVFHTPFFRVYTTNDIIGPEIAGALKNVIAIAAGVCKGFGFQANSLAAVITRGLAEIERIGARLGADPLTFHGLAGVGDLFLTCTSEKSRNFTVGYRLGKGEDIDHILKTLGSVAEGVETAKSALELVNKLGVDAPIISEVYKVLHEKKDIQTALWDLISRESKPERHA